MGFSLYYTLNKVTETRRLSSSEKKSLLSKLESLDKMRSEAALLLIVEYAIDEEGLIVDPLNIIVPYQGKQTGANVVFDVEKIPTKLLWILFKFVSVGKEPKKKKVRD
jgi:hypothetical protein